MADIRAVQLKLESVIQFLRPLLSLANCHMVNFFSGNIWENFVSSEFRSEFNDIGLPGVYEMFWHSTKLSKSSRDDSDINRLVKNSPCLHQYFSTSATECLAAMPNICLTHSQFQDKLKSWNCNVSKELSITEFMNPKKSHEVEMMTRIVAAISSMSESTHIIDVGSGRGYLSSMLAFLHGLHVLGVDSSYINSHSAIKRNEKLQKLWPGVYRRAAECCNDDIPKKRGKHWKSKRFNRINSSQDSKTENKECHLSQEKPSSKESLYRQTTMYITENSDLQDILRETFPEDGLYSNFSLVGLHTCGNLAATCLKLFSRNENIEALCNVGCCYHHIVEQFSTNPFSSELDEKNKEFGFPLSQFLISQNFALGRNARMLAAQAIDRLSEKKEVSINSLFFRALLQVILNEKLEEDRSDWQVGRIAAKCSDFKDYYNKSLKRLRLELKLTDSEISEYYEKYIEKKNELEAFFLLRVALAPIVETVIVLDRLLYLLEQGIEEAYVVQLFDPIISPRCNAVVALKHFKNAVIEK